MSCSIPMEKLSDIKILCNKWQGKHKASRKQFQSLLGKLLYITKCVRYSRIFMGRMLSTFRRQHDKHTIELDSEFHKDLAWFNTFLTGFNGAVFLQRHAQYDIFVDASFMGVGAFFENKVYAYGIPQWCRNWSIAHLELINVLITIRAFKITLRNSIVKIHCDNAAVVASLNNFRVQDELMLTIVRNIWLELASENIELITVHVPGVSNIYADVLSRWDAKSKFSSDVVNILCHECDWVFLNDSFFYLNYDI